MQDDNGPVNDSVVAADATYSRLIEAITRAGGPRYEFRQIDPVDDQDGGEPGGNIRVGFLFRTDRGLSFVDRPGGTSTTAVGVRRERDDAALTVSPGRVDPQNPAFESSRKPLAGEFRWRNQPVLVIANHFASKGGDDPLFGRVQPPVRPSEGQRHRQAAVVRDFVGQVYAVDQRANVIVLGDLNDFEFSRTADILAEAPLHDLPRTLPPPERYTYIFDGNSQVLDHILLSPGLAGNNPRHPDYEYDIVHVTADYSVSSGRVSDHDPQVVRLRVRAG